MILYCNFTNSLGLFNYCSWYFVLLHFIFIYWSSTVTYSRNILLGTCIYVLKHERTNTEKNSTILENTLVFVLLREQELTHLSNNTTISHGSYAAYLWKFKIAKNMKWRQNKNTHSQYLKRIRQKNSWMNLSPLADIVKEHSSNIRETFFFLWGNAKVHLIISLILDKSYLVMLLNSFLSFRLVILAR